VFRADPAAEGRRKKGREPLMRIALKLCLPAVVLAIAAVAAPAATAQTPTVEVTNEATGEHCPDVTGVFSGGCLVHMTAETTAAYHLFGVEAIYSDCLLEFNGRIGEGGAGYIYQTFLAGHPGLNDCMSPCYSGGSIEIKETAPGVEALAYTVCHNNGGGTTYRCAIEQPLVDTGDHSYVATATDLRGTTIGSGAVCEVDSRMTFEAGIEVAHL
jgi:hypothetical protein